MKKFSSFICKNRNIVILISILLLIPTLIGIYLTKINYDILVYLPKNNETVKGQNILTNDFNMGAFSIDIIDNMSSEDILKLENKLKKIDGVEQVVSVYDVIGTSIPLEMFQLEIVNRVKNGKSELLLITFKETTSNEKTVNAVSKIKRITKNSIKISGMSSMVLDTMKLSNKEISIYIIIAVVLCLIVLMIALDSYFVSILLLLNIGLAILYNMGSNIFLGEISYITKALTAVLQLGVTTDFSIFLYHSYEFNKDKYKTNKEAMSKAIGETFVSVIGSSLTTIAGFLVLCTMNLTLGRDLGIVMAKGVLLGVVCVLTVFPSLILFFDKVINKTRHKVIIPKFNKLKKFIIKKHKIVFVAFLILLIPAIYGYSKIQVYYKIDESLPKNLDSIVANTELKDKFNIASPEVILINNNIKDDDLNSMITELKKIDGIDFILSPSELLNLGITTDVLDKSLVNSFRSDKYQLILLNSTYDVATNELNNQVVKIKDIAKKYDKNSIVAGEGPLMKDLIDISNRDFKNVNYSSIVCILIIMLIVLKSVSLPIILIFAIEFAIFVNMGISFYSGTILPFVAPIVLGTIQLGATIDYAILMTTTYINERKKGIEKEKSIGITLDKSLSSILVSGLCFFAATFGVGVYSKLEMVGNLCTLISRGAIISMLVVIFILPSLLLIFDKLICKTTIGGKKMNKKFKLTAILLLAMLIMDPVYAFSKNETVYAKLNSNGSIKSINVSEKISNDEKLTSISDISNLNSIISLNSQNLFKQKGNDLSWTTSGIDIYYKGKIKKDLPVNVDVTYFLNNSKKSLNNILGKKGTIKIVLKYTNSEKYIINNEDLYTPFVVVTGLMLDGTNNSNVSISNGKVISNGKNYILTSLATPGLYESIKSEALKNMDTITITFDTNNFSMPAVYSLITSNIIDENNISSIDKIDTLYSSIDNLSNASIKIVDGANTLLNGSNQLKTSLSDSIGNIPTSLDEQTINYITTEAQNKSLLTDEQKNQIVIGISGNSNATYNYMIQGCELYKNTVAGVMQQYGLDEQSAKNQVNLTQQGQQGKSACDIVGIVSLVESSVQKVSLKTAETVAKQVYEQTITGVKDKLNTLYNGVSKLDSGISSLNDGVITFDKNGIQNLVSYINSTKVTTSKIKSLIKLGNKYNTFTMKDENTNGTTKFITVIDSVKKNSKSY